MKFRHLSHSGWTIHFRIKKVLLGEVYGPHFSNMPKRGWERIKLLLSCRNLGWNRVISWWLKLYYMLCIGRTVVFTHNHFMLASFEGSHVRARYPHGEAPIRNAENQKCRNSKMSNFFRHFWFSAFLIICIFWLRHFHFSAFLIFLKLCINRWSIECY